VVLSLIRREGAFAHGNTRLFVWFSMLYNARAYYPVLAILFIDLGLTLDQYMLLNAVWAATIFVLEVPSGALADTIGRKRLLVFSSVLMVLEMGVLLVAPKDGGGWLLACCLINRLLSGASEAAASGADEAIAYESLPELGRAAAWDEVLATGMRLRAAGFLVAMALGGLLYDPSWWNRWRPEWALTAETAHRLPVALVFLQALTCVFLTSRMQETHTSPSTHGLQACRDACRITLQTAHMACTTRGIALVLLGGVWIDSFARNLATVVSVYYRLVAIPEWSFGLVGAAIAVGNWLVPGIAARVNQRMGTVGALSVGGLGAGIALFALVPAWPWFGLLPVLLLMCLLGFTGYTVGRYLHAHARAEQRATLLSVKGLVFHLGFGATSLGFSALLTGLGRDQPAAFPQALLVQACLFSLPFLLFVWQARSAPAEPVR
jgi:predicted MFS family arabinose efflux permease